MTTTFAMDLAAEINVRLNGRAVLDLVGFHSDKVQQTGPSIKAFCPVHQDSRFRSLLLDDERQAFRCTIKTCKGYEGGSYIDLYAFSKEISFMQAAFQLADGLNLDLGTDWRSHLAHSYLEEVAVQREAGDFTQVEALLHELISIMPDQVDARIQLASLQAELGDEQAASEEYGHLIEHLIESGKFPEADEAASAALKLFPDNEDILFARVRIAEESGKHQLCIERMQEIVLKREASNRHMDNIGLLEQLVHKSPYDPEYALKLAALYEQQHNVRGASRQYESAARIYLAAGNTSAGIQMLERVIQFNGENVKVRLDIAKELSDFGNIERARHHTFKAINQQIDQQAFGPAVSTIENWLKLEPDSIDSRELLARVYLDQDQPDQATTYLAEGADIAAKSGDHTRAAELLLRAKFLTPDDAALRRRLIGEFTETGELQRAAFEIVDIAEILFAGDQSEEAIRLLDEGIGRDISLPLKMQMVTSLANHGAQDVALTRLKELSADKEFAPPDELSELYEVMAKLEPHDAANHCRLVHALLTVSPERAGDAAAEGAGWLTDNDKFPEAESVLETIASSLDHFVPAVPRLLELCEKCERIDLAGSIYQGTIQGFAEADPEGALKAAQRICALDPHHSSAPTDIAFLLASLGRTTDAAEQYCRVADRLRMAEDYEDALHYAKEAAALNPESVRVLACLTLCAQYTASEDERATMVNELLTATRAASNPVDISTGYLAYTELYPEDEKLLAEAADKLKNFENADGLALIQCRQAGRLAANGKWKKAASILSDAWNRAPAQGEIGEQYGEALKILQDNNGAALAYAQAAIAFAEAQDFESARRCAEQAWLCEPQEANAWEALYRATELSNLATPAAAAAQWLANYFTHEGPATSAAKWARDWVRLDPSSAQAYATLGTALLAVDQTDNAAEILSTAAGLYLKQSDGENAIGALEKIAAVATLSNRDRETLAGLQSGDFNSETKSRGNALMGRALVEAKELSDARQIALTLSKDKQFIHSAELWTLIATNESDSLVATDDLLHAAEAFETAGEREMTLQTLARATELGSLAFGVHEMYARLLDEEGRFAEALPHQLAVVTQYGADSDSRLTELLVHLAEVHAKDVDALFLVGRSLHEAALQIEATEFLEAATKLAQQNDDTTALIKICGLDETLTRNSSLLTQARADALMGMENEQQALEWIRSSGRELMLAGKAGEALEMARRWVSLTPDDANAYRLFADASDAIGDNAKANDARISLAKLLKAAGQLDVAVLEVDQVLENAPLNVPALTLKSDLLIKDNRRDEAADVLTQLAEIATAEGDHKAALRAYRDTLALRPDDISALWAQAEILQETKDVATALPVYRQWLTARKKHDIGNPITDLETVLAIAPTSVPLLRELTDALLKAGRTVDAFPYLDKLSQLLENEGNYIAAAEVLEIALSHASTKEPDRLVAIAGLYEKAASPSRAQEYLRMASQALRDKGKADSALPLLERVVKLSGDDALPEDFSTLAEAYSQAGNIPAANDSMDKALALLNKTSSNKQRREQLLQQALAVSPLNANYILQHMELLPAGRAMTEGLRASREMTAAENSEDAVKILSRLITLAPHDMSLRQELFGPLRQSGNIKRLRRELLSLATDALSAGDNDAAIEALDEAEELAETAAQLREVAEFNERARRTNKAAVGFASAAVKFAENGKADAAIASINRAVSAKPSEVSPETMAELVNLLGEPVHDIAREQLRSALTARKQKQSQILSTALLDTSTPERGIEIIKTVNSLGGSSFAVNLVTQRAKKLLDSSQTAEALKLIETLLEIAPDAADVWQLAARVNLTTKNFEDARRCALEAARLFQIAGAVIEEEESYRDALSANSMDFSIKEMLADYLVRENRPDEAVSLLQEVIAAAELNNDTDLLLECLNRAVQIAPGNTDLREKFATTLEPIAPDSAIQNWLELGRLYKDAEKPERANRIFDKVLRMHPANEFALQELLTDARERNNLENQVRYTKALADVKAKKKNVGEACRILQAYLEKDPDNLEILEKLASLSGLSNNAEVFTVTTRALAQKFQKLGNHTGALKQYELLLERSPRDVRLLTTLLDCSAAAGLVEKGTAFAQQLLAVAKETEDPERVRLAATTILDYTPDDPSAHNDLGEALLSLNRVTQAITEWLRAAELFEGGGNTAAAYTCYRRITQVNPATIQAWRRLADIAISIGDNEAAKMAVMHVLDKSSDAGDKKAGPMLARLLKALPDDSQVHKTALDYYRTCGDREAAATECLWLANAAIKFGNPEHAETLVQDGLKLNPSHGELKALHRDLIRQLGRLEELQVRLRSEAEAYDAVGNTDGAIRVMQELIEIAPGQITLHRDLSRLLTKANQTEEAFAQNLEVIRLLLERAELEEARDLADSLAKENSKDYVYRERIADLLASSAFPDVAARHYLAAAKVAQTKKNFDEAIDLLAKAVTTRPTWPEPRKTLAEACEKAGRDEQAFEAWIGLTAVLIDAGEYSEAAATLDRLAHQKPESIDVREKLSELHERTGNRTGQIEVLQELIQIYESTNRQQETLATYRKLIALMPDEPAVLSRYVELLTLHGSESDNLSEEYTRLAEVLSKQGDYEAAFQTYEQVLGLAPENTNVRSRYATFLLNRGSRNRALAEMRILADLYTERKEHPAAVEVLNAALAISPRDADLCLALAKSQEAAGMHEDARVSYARATAILASTAAVKGISTYRRILSQDENNTAVRLRLVELLMNSGDKMEAAREARILAEIHTSRGELHEAERAYVLVDQCEPESLEEIRAAISRDSYDPSLQYVHYVRLGNRLMETGDIDAALDTYRTARSLHDDEPEIIQKCIDCVSLIAPEAEAIPDYLLMAEKLLMSGDFTSARKAYEQVRLIDPFNNDARCGIESVIATERSTYAKPAVEDDLVLKAGRTVSKRVALLDLLVACQEAAVESSDEKKLGASPDKQKK